MAIQVKYSLSKTSVLAGGLASEIGSGMISVRAFLRFFDTLFISGSFVIATPILNGIGRTRYLKFNNGWDVACGVNRFYRDNVPLSQILLRSQKLSQISGTFRGALLIYYLTNSAFNQFRSEELLW